MNTFPVLEGIPDRMNPSERQVLFLTADAGVRYLLSVQLIPEHLTWAYWRRPAWT